LETPEFVFGFLDLLAKHLFELCDPIPKAHFGNVRSAEVRITWEILRVDDGSIRKKERI
jgi:hypothetical protein